MPDLSPDEQLAVLQRGCERIYNEQELRRKLSLGRPLRVKLGLDPTAPDIHLGHSVVLRKMRQFQDLGHTAVLIVGDYTARIGDPSGKNKTRPVLAPDQIDANAQTYMTQAGKILDTSAARLELRRNGEWLEGMRLADLMRLAGTTTVARMIERDTFAKRLAEGTPISLHELLYPLMQGYDSVCIESDVELGGTDQTFNNLIGRDIQQAYGQDPQVVVIMPILVGLDGTEKMSKSLGNYVGITDPAHAMFGKLMRLPDHCMSGFETLLTDGESGPTEHPMERKKGLAETITAQYHGRSQAATARREWESIHQKSARTNGIIVPDDTPDVVIPAELLTDGAAYLPPLLVHCGFAASNSEARRLMSEGGVRVDGEVCRDGKSPVPLADGNILQRGKRKFVRLRIG